MHRKSRQPERVQYFDGGHGVDDGVYVSNYPV